MFAYPYLHKQHALGKTLITCYFLSKYVVFTTTCMTLVEVCCSDCEYLTSVNMEQKIPSRFVPQELEEFGFIAIVRHPNTVVKATYSISTSDGRLSVGGWKEFVGPVESRVCGAHSPQPSHATVSKND